MKLFLLVLSSQALLCARVFSHSTADNDDQQSESDKQVASSLNRFPGKIFSQLVAADPKNIIEDSPVTKPKATHSAVETVDEDGTEANVVRRIRIVPKSKWLTHLEWSLTPNTDDKIGLILTSKDPE